MIKAFLQDKKYSRLIHSQETLIASLILCFIILRVPFLKTMFFHVDDTYVAQGAPTTYPLITAIISQFSNYLAPLTTMNINTFLLKIYITRASTLVLSCLGYYLFLKTIQLIFNNKSLTLLGGVLLCFSQMQIIYSVHSSPYGFSIISTSVLILCLIKYKKYKLKSFLFLTLLVALTLTVYIDNFAIFYFPALFITIFLSDIKNIITNTEKAKKFLTFSVFYLVNAAVYLKKILLPIINDIGDGTNYNRGISNQFIFIKENIYEGFTNPIETSFFFLKSTFLLVENNMAFYKYHSFFDSETTLKVFSILFFFSCVFLFYINRKNKIFFFIAFSFLTIFLLVYLELLALSPSRHFLGLTVFIIIIICYTLKTTPRPKLIPLVIFICVTIVLKSAFSYNTFLESKKSKISFVVLEKAIKKEKIDYIIDYEHTDFVSSLFPEKNRANFSKALKTTKSGNYRILFVSHRKPIEESPVLNEILKQKKNSVIRIVKKDIFVSKEEVGRSKRLQNGSNNRYMYTAIYKF